MTAIHEKIRVCLVTTWAEACGIAEHSALLKAAVEAADPGIAITPVPKLLDPFWTGGIPDEPDLLHLNYHAALHSRWTPIAVRAWREKYQKRVLVTYHDSGVPNSDHCKAIIDAADAAVIHEPFDDLPEDKTHYWRMGVPDLAYGPGNFPPSFHVRPVLGTVGFPFEWKCYSELARVTGEIGWGLYLIAPTATAVQVDHWRSLNPHLTVETLFVRQQEVLTRLSACDATAFAYVTHNTGQSGAILQGIGARKPVIALRTCRQFRALYLDPLGEDVIRWAEDFDEVREHLLTLPLGRLDSGIVALAAQESWAKVGLKYASLYRTLANRGGIGA